MFSKQSNIFNCLHKYFLCENIYMKKHYTILFHLVITTIN